MTGLSDFEAGNEQRVNDSHPSRQIERQDRTAECVKLELASPSTRSCAHLASTLSPLTDMILPRCWLRVTSARGFWQVKTYR
jgi:acetolactate synthase regulatory subunit